MFALKMCRLADKLIFNNLISFPGAEPFEYDTAIVR